MTAEQESNQEGKAEDATARECFFRQTGLGEKIPGVDVLGKLVNDVDIFSVSHKIFLCYQSKEIVHDSHPKDKLKGYGCTAKNCYYVFGLLG